MGTFRAYPTRGSPLALVINFVNFVFSPGDRVVASVIEEGSSGVERALVIQSIAFPANGSAQVDRARVLLAGLSICLCLFFGTEVCIASDDFTGWADVIEQNLNSTILIRIESAGKPPSYGSGVVIDATGHVLTAKHLLPDAKTRTTGTFLMSALVGWDSPSIDFSHASVLDIEYISDCCDLAILRFRSRPKGSRYAFADVKLRQGQPLLAMGYPSGGSLAATAGIASQEGADGKYATDAQVGVGDSGGPVFGSSGGLLGIVLQGTRRTDEGQIALGYFLTSRRILDELSKERPSIHVAQARLPFERPIVRMQQLTVSYPVNDDKVDHPSLASTTKSFEHSFAAQEGFRISESSFQSNSANHVASGPVVQLLEGGALVVIRFTLESGPIFDQWRGWLDGAIVTKQVRR
jgi:S1-C subfamily serine protease